MADCVSIHHCPFFRDKMAKMPAMANLIKQSVCKTNPQGCARYMVLQAKGRGSVPLDLFPDDIERARAIIRSS